MIDAQNREDVFDIAPRSNQPRSANEAFMQKHINKQSA